jgi:hypothetical protein
MVGTGNGTSFSSPVMAGLATCLWQKHRDVTNDEIMKAIRRTASQFDSPDSLLGYGIPNLELADLLLSSTKPAASRLHLFPNPAEHSISLWYRETEETGSRYEIIDVTGRKIQDGMIWSSSPNQAEVNVQGLKPGPYIILVYTGQERMEGIFIKQ